MSEFQILNSKFLEWVSKLPAAFVAQAFRPANTAAGSPEGLRYADFETRSKGLRYISRLIAGQKS